MCAGSCAAASKEWAIHVGESPGVRRWSHDAFRFHFGPARAVQKARACVVYFTRENRNNMRAFGNAPQST